LAAAGLAGFAAAGLAATFFAAAGLAAAGLAGFAAAGLATAFFTAGFFATGWVGMISLLQGKRNIELGSVANFGPASPDHSRRAWMERRLNF
jgi:hypothetical protein